MTIRARGIRRQIIVYNDMHAFPSKNVKIAPHLFRKAGGGTISQRLWEISQTADAPPHAPVVLGLEGFFERRKILIPVEKELVIQ